MRVLAAFALLAAPALAFMPAAPRAARINSRLVLNAGGEYSTKVRMCVSLSSWIGPVCERVVGGVRV